MSFEPRANYGGGFDFSTFRVVLDDRNAKRRDVCLSEAPRLSRVVLGKPGGIVDLSRPQKFDRKDCLNWKFIAKVILHFHLHPQFKYELFHVYFTSEI